MMPPPTPADSLPSGRLPVRSLRGRRRPGKKGPANREGKFRLHVRRVLLDAGHGGRDPGTHHNGILERTVTLDLAKRVGAILAAHDIDVKYTRFSNRWVSLDARADKVRTTRADLFISIHVNANPSSSVQGFETYYLDFARTSAASRLAAVENAIKGRSAASREKLPASKLFRVQQQESSRLARNIQNTTLGYLRGKKYATVGRAASRPRRSMSCASRACRACWWRSATAPTGRKPHGLPSQPTGHCSPAASLTAFWPTPVGNRRRGATSFKKRRGGLTPYPLFGLKRAAG